MCVAPMYIYRIRIPTIFRHKHLIDSAPLKSTLLRSSQIVASSPMLHQNCAILLEYLVVNIRHRVYDLNVSHLARALGAWLRDTVR